MGRRIAIAGSANGTTLQTTFYSYDGLGRVTNVLYPDGNEIEFVYNPAGKVIQRTDQRGIVTNYGYDGVYNQVSKAATVGGVVSSETFSYDGLGRVLTAVKVVDSNTISETEFVYNAIGRITDANETLFDGNTFELHYSYDQAGNTTFVDYPGSADLTIVPDFSGRIDSITIGAIPLVAYEYTGPRVAQRTYPHKNIISRHTYDNFGRVTNIYAHQDGNEIVDFAYQYKPETHNISRQTYAHRPNDPYTDFSYDNLNRLTIAQYGIQDNNEIFTMDKLGNRTAVNLRDGNNVSYTVDNVTNRYSAIGANSLAYNNAGDLTLDKDGYQYSYDYENRVTKITKGGNDIVEYAYDALGRRIYKKDFIDSTASRLYYHNHKWQVVRETNLAEGLILNYVYGNYIDEVLLSGVLAYIHDHLYSPVAKMHITSGALLERYEYDAYGKPTFIGKGVDGQWFTGDDTIAYKPASSTASPFMFTGRGFDFLDNGNLILGDYRNRQYDIYMARFYQHDPLGITPNPQRPNIFNIKNQYSDGLNLYQYVKSDPVKSTDPWGLICGVVVKRTKAMSLTSINAGHEWIAWEGDSIGFWPNRNWKVESPDPAEEYNVPVFWKWHTEHIGWSSTFKWGPKKGCCCKIANCASIISCLDSTPNPGWRSFGMVNNCRRFAAEALDGCCLKKGELISYE